MTIASRPFRRNSTRSSGKRNRGETDSLYYQTIFTMLSPSTSTAHQLAAFKDTLRQALLSDSLALPLYSVEKVFDFSAIRHTWKSKQAFSLNMKSVSLLARLLQIVEVSLELLGKGQTITKRNLYYKLARYYAGKYPQLDCDIQLLCFNTHLSREQLRVLSSSKCLLFGEVTISHSQGQAKCSPATITNFPTADAIGPAITSCKRLVIVEKESAMYQLHQELVREAQKEEGEAAKVLRETIFLSAKGYPDSTSRTVVEALLPLVEDIYYLGDSDIYGVDILLCYSVGLGEWSTFLPRVNWIQLERLVSLQDLQGDLLLQSKEDRFKCIEVLERPYFRDIEAWLPLNEEQRQFQAKLLCWKQQLVEIQRSDFKMELESLFKQMRQDWQKRMFSGQTCL